MSFRSQSHSCSQSLMQITCNHCRACLQIDDGFAGGVCRCRYCGTIQTVPVHEAPAPDSTRRGPGRAASGRSRQTTLYCRSSAVRSAAHLGGRSHPAHAADDGPANQPPRDPTRSPGPSLGRASPDRASTHHASRDRASPATAQARPLSARHTVKAPKNASAASHAAGAPVVTSCDARSRPSTSSAMTSGAVTSGAVTSADTTSRDATAVAAASRRATPSAAAAPRSAQPLPHRRRLRRSVLFAAASAAAVTVAAALITHGI